MLKLCIAVMALVMTGGCSTVNIQRKTTERMVHPEFRDYVNRFKVAHYRLTGEKISTRGVIIKRAVIHDIKIDDKNVIAHKNQAIGYCVPSRSLPAIYIDTFLWDTLPDLSKEALVFHELGHCVLRRNHCDYTFRGIPISVMRSTLVKEKHYFKYREHYLYELFAKPACDSRF